MLLPALPEGNNGRQKSQLYNRNASAFARRCKPSAIHAGAGSPFPVTCPQSVYPYSGFFENIQVLVFNFY
jgi:hypothetical protein